jgi:indolepyruvate ferredoxin oxidoreductase beta subunit
LAAAVDRAGLPVIAGQLHGMSQRGGSVECSLIIGEASSSFIVGAPDVVLAFEPLELLRCAHLLGANTQVVANTTQVMPPGVDPRTDRYPSMEAIFERAGKSGALVRVIDGPQLVERIGEKRTLNMLMLGALVELGCLQITAEQVRDAIAERSPTRFLDANLAAFELGRSELAQAAQERSAPVQKSAGVRA